MNLISRQKFSLVSASAVAAIAVLCASPAWARRHHKFKGVVVVNQIIKLDGTIMNNGVQAQEFSGVKTGDVLETGDRSYADIRIPGLAIFRMGPNTKFHLSSFSDRNESRFELQKGTLLSLFRRTGHHIVQLNHGTLTLHGTTFFVQSDPTGDADQICLCDGKISAVVKAVKAVKAAKVREPLSEKASAGGPSPTTTATADVTASPGPSAGSGPSTPPSPEPAATAAPTALPSPTATPLPQELDVVSNNEHKQFEVGVDGIAVKDLKLLDLHSNKEIQDLESLYDLP